LLASGDPALRAAAVRLAGLWKTAALLPAIEKSAFAADAPTAPRLAALVAFAQIRGREAAEALGTLVADVKSPEDFRRTALEALSIADRESAARTVAALLTEDR